MALAQQLAELGLANSQGLLNDDEYRLLRRNLFEQHANSTLIPVEVPILPVAGPGRKSSTSSTNPTRTPTTHVDTPALLAPPTLRRRGSFVTKIFRRATGSKEKAPTDPPRSPAVPVPPARAPKRKQSIPQIIQRKASELFSGRRVDPPVPTSPDSPHTRRPSNPPSSPRRTTIPTFPSISTSSVDLPSSPSASNDVFDDRNLRTAKDIRAAIIATEAEAQRLLEAFTNLESTTVHRIELQNGRRLATTPEQPHSQTDGTDWRGHHHPQVSSPPSPRPSKSDRKGKGKASGHRHMPSLVDSIADSSSVYSASSSISRSKSILSLRIKQPPHPASPLSPRFAPSASPSPQLTRPPRKNSVSSVASQSTRLRISTSPSVSLSRSTGHLPLRTLVEGDGASRLLFADSRPGTGSTADTHSHPEVQEVQQRREEVMSRYVARLEYLQARLKSAELHEKLARR